ncbi:acyl-CoA dehydrogenase [Saccharophagus sp. K07]|uniref:acyl-CoA dehydrogenase C-terminal domain-containing protein n=1 Tax=Saccharophagus sp. K07 TaxID=2283636 RepID=UPI001651E942|nr:acyl-CoA dehydrogenase C-terminal domain-containing protein [Saccharophagus sp. K07]MBC6907227.1 acyl-CoA dehydrogenase [Saccharophagus sp. K07]
MADYRAPLQDMRFVLFDVLKSADLWRSLARLNELDEDTAEAALGEAAKICEEVIAPLNQEGDEVGCQWSAEGVTTPPGFRDAYRVYNEGGWGALGGNPEYGGMGMPKSLVSAVEEMLQGACMSFGLAPMLTAGACLALDAHGDESLKSLYLPKMYSGEWSGAMDLTEPHAGTDLGMIRTRAEPQSDGTYKLYGTKIFITWGEHDMAENIVHLVLAKLPNAPAGTKGISLFLVPKFIPTPDGAIGARNALSCGALEKKMGIKGSATCVMNFDGAQGWLVGEVNQGLACMFTMMNYERVVVGIQALGTAQWAYQNAVEYARERIQSRSPTGVQNPAGEADPLLVHPDVRRMLLTAKAYNEGGRAFYVYAAQWLDIAKFTDDPARKKLAENRIALLTPVAKAFISDMAFEAAVACQQVFGGHGYIREWGQEQFVRDIRITQIYEGTNGIQAMDLMGRKTVACGGALLAEYLLEINEFMDTERDTLDSLGLTAALRDAVVKLGEITQVVITRSAQNPCDIGAAAVEYLHLLGHVSYAYLWARMACVASRADASPFTDGKIKTAQFYFAHLLPRIEGLFASLQRDSGTLMALQEDQF